MLRYGISFLFVFVLFFAALPAGHRSHAQETENSSVDLLVLVNDSGSMSDPWSGGTRQPNDPDGIRHSAARMLIDLAQPGDRVAVVSFHRQAFPYGEAVQGRMTTIDETTNRTALKAPIVQPTEPEDPMQRITHLDLGLGAVVNVVENTPTDRPRYLIFFTDGHVFPPDQLPDVREHIAALARADVTIIPVILGDDIEEGLTDQMAADTGGTTLRLRNIAGLPDFLVELYQRIAPDRYLDVVEADTDGGVRFDTLSEQGVTGLRVVSVHPRGQAGISDVQLNEQSPPAFELTSPGSADHYTLARAQSADGLVGEWSANLSPTASRRVLITAEARTRIRLAQPSVTPPDRQPTVVYPAGQAPLLMFQVDSDGRTLPAAPMRAWVNDQSVELRSDVLSRDGSLRWVVLASELGRSPGQRASVRVELGPPDRGFRLVRTLILESRALPVLVADEPELLEDGRMSLRARMVGNVVPAELQITAYVYDEIGQDFHPLAMECSELECTHSAFQTQRGLRYAIVLVAEAVVDNVRYTDVVQTRLSLRDAILLDNLGHDLDLGVMPPLQDVWERDLRVIAQTDDPPLLSVALEMDQPAPGVDVRLGNVERESGNIFRAPLRITGLERLPAGDYSGELRFRSGEFTDVDPGLVSLAFTVPAPEARLHVPGSINLGELIAPGDRELFSLVAEFTRAAPVSLSARLDRLTRDGEAASVEPFDVVAGPPQPTDDPLRFEIPVEVALLTRPPAGSYRADLILTSDEGTAVEPSRVPLFFSVPQSEIILAIRGDLLDFGAVGSLAEPISLNLEARRTVVDEPPTLQVQIVDVYLAGDETAESPPFDIRTGLVQAEVDGTYRVPLFLSASGEVPYGVYRGTIAFSSPDGVPIRPERVTFNVRHLTSTGMILHRLTPIANFVQTWFWPFPFPQQWTGFIGWLALIVIINTVIRARPRSHAPRGMVSVEETGNRVPVSARDQVFVVRKPDGVTLSRRAQDRRQALATISLEPRVSPRSDRTVWRPVLRRSPLASTDVRVAYYIPNTGRWKLVGEPGAVLPNNATFRVRLAKDGEKYHFHYIQENSEGV